jgi:protein-L-isoaspartate(D-aspartate) O-methyltransferase
MQAWFNKVTPGLHAAAVMTIILAGVTPLRSDDAPGQSGDEAQQYTHARQMLMAQIESNVRSTSAYLGKDALDPRVMAALARVPRHEFVPDSLRHRAYEDRPLPIGHGQTISQPYIVAIMTDLLALSPGCKVLDIGTGSGYQAAVLAEICDTVYSIEIVEQLGLEARARLKRLEYENITVRVGDGFHGWPEQAPFDAIVVAAVAKDPPPPLLEQLKPGGRLIMPVGMNFGGQKLVLVEKQADGQLSTTDILPVRFVPLTGDHD